MDFAYLSDVFFSPSKYFFLEICLATELRIFLKTLSGVYNICRNCESCTYHSHRLFQKCWIVQCTQRNKEPHNTMKRDFKVIFHTKRKNSVILFPTCPSKRVLLILPWNKQVYIWELWSSQKKHSESVVLRASPKLIYSLHLHLDQYGVLTLLMPKNEWFSDNFESMILVFHVLFVPYKNILKKNRFHFNVCSNISHNPSLHIHASYFDHLVQLQSL